MFLGSLLTPNYAQAEVVPLPPVAIFMDVPVPPDVEDLIYQAEAKYNLKDDSLYETLKCESIGWKNGQSKIPHKGGPNGYEDSWGVAQIHLPAHKDITKEEALDPVFAVDWAASEFAAGRAYEWTCYRDLYE